MRLGAWQTGPVELRLRPLLEYLRHWWSVPGVPVSVDLDAVPGVRPLVASLGLVRGIVRPAAGRFLIHYLHPEILGGSMRRTWLAIVLSLCVAGVVAAQDEPPAQVPQGGGGGGFGGGRNAGNAPEPSLMTASSTRTPRPPRDCSSSTRLRSGITTKSPRPNWARISSGTPKLRGPRWAWAMAATS